MILLQLHHMWYETNMIQECWDSILAAKRAASDVELKIKLCFNKQTYIETPSEGLNVDNFFQKHMSHSLITDKDTELIIKTNNDAFYNIADWRREVYDPKAKYTVWGETDTILPKDIFAILNKLDIKQPHVVTFAGRPMWDNSWDVVTHERLLGWDKPCQCKPHKDDCIELLEAPWKYKDYITQKQLDKFNEESGDIKIEQVPWKVDGSTVCLSGGIETPFIAPGMHFVREDTCLEYFLRKKNIPQVCVKTRLKGHNYWHPQKRVGTSSTRDDKVFKEYASKSQIAMNEFLKNL